MKNNIFNNKALFIELNERVQCKCDSLHMQNLNIPSDFGGGLLLCFILSKTKMLEVHNIWKQEKK